MPGSMWTGMPHGFAGSVGKLKAAAKTLDAIGTLLAARRQASA
jgi:monoterpene epsilon-lactone hydrolase